MLLLFAHQRYLQLHNSVTWKTSLKRMPFILMGLGFWILFYLGSHKTVSYLLGLGFIGESLASKLLSMVFFSLTGFLTLSNVITALSSFYLSREVPFLLTRPLEVKDILRLKTAETVMNSSWMVLSFTPPVFIAYGAAYGAGPSYYCVVFLSLALLIVLTAGLGIMIAHLLARIVPARWSRNILLGVGLLMMVAAYVFVKTSVGTNPSPPEELLIPLMSFGADSPLLPSTWLMNSVAPELTGKGTGMFYLLVLVSNSAFMLMLGALAGSRLYLTNLGRMQPAGQSAGAGFLGRSAPGAAAAMPYKDLRVFIRDTGQWSQVFIIGALVFVYIYNFRAIPLSALTEFTLIREIMLMVNLCLAGLVLSAVAARFVYTAVSLEGQAFWIIRSAPVDINRFLCQKFLQAVVPVTAVVLIMVFLVNTTLGIRGITMCLSLGVMAMLCISICGLGTGMGAMQPRFRYENIASVSMGLGGMAFMVISFTLVLFTLGVMAWLCYHAMAGHAQGAAALLRPGLGIPLVLLANGLALCLPMRWGAAALRELEL